MKCVFVCCLPATDDEEHKKEVRKKKPTNARGKEEIVDKRKE